MPRASTITFLLLALSAGCVSQRHLELTTTDAVPVPVEVHVLDPGLCQIEAISCDYTDGEWVLSGRIVCRDSRLYTQAHRLVKIQAIRVTGGSDETGEVLFCETVVARRSPSTVHHQASRRGTFHSKIPAPEPFDRLDVTLIAPDEAN